MEHQIRVTDGELTPESYCVVCNGCGTTLPTDCPGTAMSSNMRIAIKDGILDYVRNRWLYKCKHCQNFVEDLDVLNHSCTLNRQIGFVEALNKLDLEYRPQEQTQRPAQSARTPIAEQFPHYYKNIDGLKVLDVYRILELFDVNNPCIAHAVKKLLVAGGRGAKDQAKDIAEAIISLQRWQDIQNENEQRAV